MRHRLKLVGAEGFEPFAFANLPLSLILATPLWYNAEMKKENFRPCESPRCIAIFSQCGSVGFFAKLAISTLDHFMKDNCKKHNNPTERNPL